MSSKKKNAPSLPKKPRLFSLDVLRGFDMFVFLLFGPLTIALAQGPLANQFESKKFLQTLLAQMEHCTWDGFTLWDQIMPLFLFWKPSGIQGRIASYLLQHTSGDCRWISLRRPLLHVFRYARSDRDHRVPADRLLGA